MVIWWRAAGHSVRGNVQYCVYSVNIPIFKCFRRERLINGHELWPSQCNFRWHDTCVHNDSLPPSPLMSDNTCLVCYGDGRSILCHIVLMRFKISFERDELLTAIQWWNNACHYTWRASTIYTVIPSPLSTIFSTFVKLLFAIVSFSVFSKAKFVPFHSKSKCFQSITLVGLEREREALYKLSM